MGLWDEFLSKLWRKVLFWVTPYPETFCLIWQLHLKCRSACPNKVWYYPSCVTREDSIQIFCLNDDPLLKVTHCSSDLRMHQSVLDGSMALMNCFVYKWFILEICVSSETIFDGICCKYIMNSLPHLFDLSLKHNQDAHCKSMSQVHFLSQGQLKNLAWHQG